MGNVKAFFKKAQVISVPTKMNGENGEYYIFSVKADNDRFSIVCFDDAREKNAFKKLRNALEKKGIKKGTYIYMECDVSKYWDYLIKESEWKKISDEANPTKVSLCSFKLLEWDYLIPYEIHSQLSNTETKKEIQPITVEQMGGSIL